MMSLELKINQTISKKILIMMKMMVRTRTKMMKMKMATLEWI